MMATWSLLPWWPLGPFYHDGQFVFLSWYHVGPFCCGSQLISFCLIKSHNRRPRYNHHSLILQMEHIIKLKTSISLWHHASNTQEWCASHCDIMHQTPNSDVHLSVTSCIKHPRVMCISRWHHASNAQEWCASLGDIMHQTPKSDVHLLGTSCIKHPRVMCTSFIISVLI